MAASRSTPLHNPGERGLSQFPQLGAVLKEYRKNNGLSQRELGELLHVDQSYVSKIERGKPIKDVEFLLRVTQVLEVPPAHLGLSADLIPSANRSEPSSLAVGNAVDHQHDIVVASQNEWRGVRRHLNQHRHEFAQVAVNLYEPGWRVGRSPLIAPPGWLPDEPVRLDDIDLQLVQDRSAPYLTGGEPEGHAARPMRRPGHQFERYTSAIRYLDPPSLFENRPSYRLLDLRWAAGGGNMRFGLATYFDKLDVAEAVGHEFAGAAMHKLASDLTMSDLPFRGLIGDPFDTARRAVLPAVTTLCLRRRPTHGTASFLLHWRDPSKVATAAGVYDVIPAGEFQPSSVASHDLSNDFDVWRSIVREFSEELLGEPEHDGSSGVPIDYTAWPLYRTLEAARESGELAIYCLGAGVDALTLAPTIMTVVVMDDVVFDDAFREAVDVNAEGVIVFGESGTSKDAKGLPFDAKTVKQLLEVEPMASPGAACLTLAWRHRMALLAP